MAQRGRSGGITTVQRKPLPTARASIDTRNQSRKAQAAYFSAGSSGNTEPDTDEAPALSGDMTRLTPEESLERIKELATHEGDLSSILPPGVLESMAEDAIREWEEDQGSRSKWMQTAERALMMAAQERDEDDDQGKDYPFENASDVNYPILTTAAYQFQARAAGGLIVNNEMVKVQAFQKPADLPSPDQRAMALAPPAAPGTPPTPQQQQIQQATQAADLEDLKGELAADANETKSRRIAMFMNWLLFFGMEDWAGETDILLLESSIVGIGFKKVYTDSKTVCSEYVSAQRLTVAMSTKNLMKCPRITQDYDIYPYEIEQGIREGKWRDVTFPRMGNDPEAPRLWIEQHRMADLDGDGLSEPYILTVDVETRKPMRLEAAYTADDVIIDEEKKRVKRIERWLPYACFVFLPDVKGRFYATGLGKLLDIISDSVDTTLNQLIDAGNAQIAGGGFIGSQVRIAGAGQGGNVFKRPGEYIPLNISGTDIRQAIYEATVPQPSEVSFKMLDMLLGAAKDIASIKDVTTGDTPATAPVGTTMAVQDQALTQFVSIFGRYYRGFTREFWLMYQVIKRWPTTWLMQKYTELTGGDLKKDFSGDGTDVQPIADPTNVTKMQKVARLQTLSKWAESPVGQAAGMLQPGPSKAISEEALSTMGYANPERFLGQPPPPNPEVVARAQEVEAETRLKAAQGAKAMADATLAKAKAERELGLTDIDAKELGQGDPFPLGPAAAPSQGVDNGQPSGGPPTGGPPTGGQPAGGQATPPQQPQQPNN